MSLQQVNSSNFEQAVLNSDKPVLVDFWAEWCGPCRVLGPVLEEISGEIGTKANIVKLNVDESRDLAMKYGIRGIPTMILFKNGQVVNTLVGNQPKDVILKSIDAL
ncbi:thioredoxin [Peredibacter starrii]|uniref:Thioredoxin n=1 Tax=Peredibacter starrii TaxID=28202 RepID=A0AAX4HU99_9BACT|nr:thioredoxin [Peredibacter starrii]WPU66817.1 thioredoxin [Peredibacter starrii]